MTPAQREAAWAKAAEQATTGPVAAYDDLTPVQRKTWADWIDTQEQRFNVQAARAAVYLTANPT